MTIKTLAAAVALSILPALSFAGGCNFERQVMTCSDGTTFDAETGTCVPSVNS